MKYEFRGVLVFEYDPKTKATKAPHDEWKYGNFNFCQFIPEDYEIMAEFFSMAHLHATGKIKTEDLKDFEVG